MSILSKAEMKRRMGLAGKDVKDPEGLVVTPLLRADDAMDVDSLDLRLSSYFLLPRLSHQPFICPDRRSVRFSQLSVHVPLGRYLVVPAHQTVLGATLEFIKLPYDVAGQILTKSSVARTFIVVETAPWIHPSYRGCLTLEIANVSNTPLLLYPGRSIAQLILMEVLPKPNRPEEETYDPKYLGPVYPEPPPFKDPEEDLREIGVEETETWVIPEPGPASDVRRRR